MKIKNCPCGNNKFYDACCGEILSGRRNAKTSEELMRSRYTAFTLANGDYLMKSHHSTTRPIKEKKEIEEWAQSVTWVRLEILMTTGGKQEELEGTVEFKAYFLEGGKMQMIHENSFFNKENKKWVYVGVAE